MPLYEVSNTGLFRQRPAAFAELKMYERADLQRLLREDIAVLGDDLLVIAEEFGEWEDARRRIDLLALDKAGRLVVIELKRTDDGGHMELQAVRYAAMFSSMGFPEVLAAYTAHCAKHRTEEVDPRAELESFLDSGETGEDPVIATDVRIILVSANFGREITTAVLWLNRFDGMDIRCFRLTAYEIAGKILLDIQQVIPLPEAADYQVRLRRKDAARERASGDGRDLTRYCIVEEGTAGPELPKRQAIRSMLKTLAARGAPMTEISKLLPKGKIRVLSGRFEDAVAVREALQAADPKIDLGRWFSDYSIFDKATAQTCVVSKMWGVSTEPTLKALSEAFPEAKVTFRRGEQTED